MKPFFSIVMPAYKAEKYIADTLASIGKQTFSDWECIVVEDGSPDRTKEIVREAATKDSRIRLIEQPKNCGVSEARNRGIQEAAGEYLWFADADDTVEEDLLEKVYQSLQKNRAKLVLFGIALEYYDRQGKFSYEEVRVPEEMYLTDPEQIHQQLIYMERETLYGYPVNKVYDLQYLNQLGITFDDYRNAKFIEDICFNIEFCMEIDSMNLLDFAPYHYAKRVNGSLTNEFVPDYYRFLRKRIQKLYEQCTYWKADTEENRQILGSLYGRYILSAMERNCDPRSGMSHRDRKDWCRKLFVDPLFLDLVMDAKASDSRMLKIALRILRTRSRFLCLSFARAIHIARNQFPIFYSKVKAGR